MKPEEMDAIDNYLKNISIKEFEEKMIESGIYEIEPADFSNYALIDKVK